MASTTARGYGSEHQKLRKRLLAELIPGTPCRRCGKPMYPWQQLDLGHHPDRPASLGYRADALEHAVPCNRGHRTPTPKQTKQSRRW